MTPYYDDGGITIYHGDCREMLADLKADAVVTDPPYGLDFRGHEWDGHIPDWLSLARPVAPVTAFTTAPTTMWDYPRPDWVACWYRPASNARSIGGGFNHWSPVLVYGRVKIPVDCINLHAIQNSAPKWVKHPTPKPIKLMRWVVSWAAPEGGSVVDPFAGSGTTLQAAKDLGRSAIGVEIDERYCEIAAKRLDQEVLPFEGVA